MKKCEYTNSIHYSSNSHKLFYLKDLEMEKQENQFSIEIGEEKSSNKFGPQIYTNGVYFYIKI